VARLERKWGIVRIRGGHQTTPSACEAGSFGRSYDCSFGG